MRAEGAYYRTLLLKLLGMRNAVVLIAVLVLVVFGVKVLFINHFGSAVPFWDQWDAEADTLYKAYLNSNLSFATLLSSHNEHRILTSRLFSLALFELNGGWDPILQMIANSALHVAAIVLLVLNIQRIVPSAQFILLVFLSTFVFVWPIGWENLLAGFQNQFYFLLIFSLLALMGFATAPAFSIAWWFSLFCSTAAYFSLASGGLTAVAAFAVVLLQILSGHRRGAREYIAALSLLATSVVMVVFVQRVAGHDVYKSHGIAEFFSAMLSCLSFPRISPYVGIWINVPLAVYACAVLKLRPVRQSPHWTILGIIIWLVLQEVALAYGRGMRATSSRYLDVIIIGLPINFGVLLLAKSKFSPNGWKGAAVFAIIAWLVVVVPGLLWNTLVSSFPAVVEKAVQGREQHKNVLAYLAAGDLAELQGKSPQAIPYPDPARLAALLSDSSIRLVLPDPIRPADVNEKARLDRTFLKGRLRSITVRIKTFILSYAHVYIGIGIALAFGAGLIGRCPAYERELKEV